MKIFSGSVFVTGVKLICSLILNKIFTLFLGPAGFALIGQFQNLIAMGFAGSSLSLQNGWVSLTAKSAEDHAALTPIWRAGLRLTMAASLLVSLLILILIQSDTLFLMLFPESLVIENRAMLLFAIPGILSLTIAMVCQSAANGLGDYRRFAILSIFASISQCLWVFIFLKTSSWNLFAVIGTQSLLSAVFSLWFCRRTWKRYHSISGAGVQKKDFRIWLPFIAMGLLPMLFSPLVQMLTRSVVANHLGWNTAGLWQGAFRISDAFNVLFSSVLVVLILPHFSRISDAPDFYIRLKKILIRVLGLSAFCILFFTFFRTLILRLLFTEDFVIMAPYLPIQFLGDFFRPGCWCLGIVLVARQAAKPFLLIELFSQLLFFFISAAGISYFGIRAPFFAYATENAVTFVILFFTVRKLVWKRP